MQTSTLSTVAWGWSRMSDEPTEAAGAPGGGDAGADVTPDEVAHPDEQDAAGQDTAGIPIGGPMPWRSVAPG